MADKATNYGGVAGKQLKAFIERVERLEEEKQAITDDIKEVYGEAKGNGFDTKVMRQVVKLRKMDRADRQEFEAILDLYMHALGMVPIDEAADGAHSSKAKAERAKMSTSVSATISGVTVGAGEDV